MHYYSPTHCLFGTDEENLFLYKVDSNYLKSNISPFKLILKTKL